MAKPTTPKADEKTKQLVWELLRSFEEKCGKAALPLDKDLIVQGYRWMNEQTGANNKPSYFEVPKY